MRKLILVVIIALIQSCGGSSEKSATMTDSKMTATIGEETYNIEVRYYLDDENGLTVYSDKNDVTDSNNDGLIFAIFEYNGNLQFDFVKDDARLGGKITNWEKGTKEIKGSGKLRPESGLGQSTPVTFKIDL